MNYFRDKELPGRGLRVAPPFMQNYGQILVSLLSKIAKLGLSELLSLVFIENYSV